MEGERRRTGAKMAEKSGERSVAVSGNRKKSGAESGPGVAERERSGE